MLDAVQTCPGRCSENRDDEEGSEERSCVTGLISSMWTYVESFSRIAMVGEDSFEMYLR